MLFYLVIVKKKLKTKKIVFKVLFGQMPLPQKNSHFEKKSQQQSHAHDRNFLHAKITQFGS
jgi:hypothetical protein